MCGCCCYCCYCCGCFSVTTSVHWENEETRRRSALQVPKDKMKAGKKKQDEAQLMWHFTLRARERCALKPLLKASFENVSVKMEFQFRKHFVAPEGPTWKQHHQDRANNKQYDATRTKKQWVKMSPAAAKSNCSQCCSTSARSHGVLSVNYCLTTRGHSCLRICLHRTGEQKSKLMTKQREGHLGSSGVV